VNTYLRQGLAGTSALAEEGDLMRYLELTMPDDPEETGNAGER